MLSKRLQDERLPIPTSTLSITDIFENSLIFWKVLAIPFLFMSMGDFPVISSPSSMKEPVVGLYTPVSILKTVVLPAPFGPISP